MAKTGRLSLEEKKRVVESLSRPGRPVQVIIDNYFPGLSARKRSRDQKQKNAKVT